MTEFELSAAYPSILVALPLAAATVAFRYRRPATVLGIGSACIASLAALLLAGTVSGAAVGATALGGWAAPLGIVLRVDGLSALMLLLTAAVGLTGAGYAVSHGRVTPADSTLAFRRYFWPLWLFLWAALNALFLSADLFNLYVALEFVALAAVALVALNGEPQALRAAMRYLLATLLGSVIYLLGVALLYGSYGTLELQTVTAQVRPDQASTWAAALISCGLLLKAAVFPLHFWLPAAHSRAPAAVSAVLSGVVVAAAFYVLLRLWLGPFQLLLGSAGASVLGGLGVAAIFWGGLQALRQRRLKLLIAYSTVSQLGYGMLIFPLLNDPVAADWAWSGALIVVFAHGLAKTALFLAAGCITYGCGHDRLNGLPSVSRASPWPWLAVALGSASLIGLPPSGGFLGKWLLLQSALSSGAWFWGLAIVGGTVLTAAYLLRLLEGALRPQAPAPARPIPAGMQAAALLPALAAVLLGLLALPLLDLLQARG